MKKVLFILLICTLLISSMAFAKEFPDVASTHWAHQYISELSDQKVINGYEDGTYRPDGTVTRAEFIKLIVCTSKERMFFSDLSEYYFGPYSNWYDKYFFVSKDYLSFDFDEQHNAPITRIEMSRVVQDFAKADGLVSKGTKKNFTDVETLCDLDKDAVNSVQDYGIINGYEDGSFRPANKMTRAEVSAVISRYIQARGGID